MIEIIRTYPIIFIITVILPIAGGFVGAYLGLDALKSRIEDDAHKKTIQKSLSSIDSRLAPISDQIATIQRYEASLASHNQKDSVLAAVLNQYQQMHHAIEQFYSFRGSESDEEKRKLAENILETITSNIVQVKEAPNLPNDPLIISLGGNTFKVIFSVPMRIPPRLEFQGLPDGVIAKEIEKTEFGFTVQFAPLDTPVTRFDFTADAEL